MRRSVILRDRDGDAVDPLRYSIERGAVEIARDRAFAVWLRAWVLTLTREELRAIRSARLPAKR